MDIAQRVDALRICMKENGISMYYIPSNDFHNSEYTGNYFKCREFISGFDGSAELFRRHGRKIFWQVLRLQVQRLTAVLTL